MKTEETNIIYGSGMPDEEELRLINLHTVEPLEAHEVFCFSLTLCDNEVDRDFERFSVEALKALEPMFVGKTGIDDHSMKSEHQHSRIFKTWIEASKNEKTTAGENYTALRAKAYIPINEKSNRLICGIKAGIKKETSISCSMGRLVCSICSADLRSGGCKHRKGEVYNGRVCHTVLENPLDAYEFSFVAVPAQPRAGVTKAAHTDDTRFVKQAACGEITLSKSAFTQLNAEIQRLEQLKKDGEFYREELKAKVARLAVMAVPELGGCELDSVYDTLSTKQLLRLRDAFSVSAARHYPLKPQLGTAAAEYHTDNNEFKI